MENQWCSVMAGQRRGEAPQGNRVDPLMSGQDLEQDGNSQPSVDSGRADKGHIVAQVEPMMYARIADS